MRKEESIDSPEEALRVFKLLALACVLAPAAFPLLRRTGPAIRRIAVTLYFLVFGLVCLYTLAYFLWLR